MADPDLPWLRGGGGGLGSFSGFYSVCDVFFFFTQNEEGPSALASPLDPPLTPALKWPYSPALSKVYVFVYDMCDLFNKLTSFLCFCPLVDDKLSKPWLEQRAAAEWFRRF